MPICVFASEVASLTGYNKFVTVDEAIDNLVSRIDSHKASRKHKRKRKIQSCADKVTDAPKDITCKKQRRLWVSKKLSKVQRNCELARSLATSVAAVASSSTDDDVKPTPRDPAADVSKTEVEKAIETVIRDVADYKKSGVEDEEVVVQTVLKTLKDKKPALFDPAAPTIIATELVKRVDTRRGCEDETKVVKTFCPEIQATNQETLRKTVTMPQSGTPVVLYGKCDGVEHATKTVIEIKSRRSRLYRRAWPNEVVQMHVYMCMAGYTRCKFIEKCGSGGVFEEIIEFSSEMWDNVLTKLDTAVQKALKRLG